MGKNSKVAASIFTTLAVMAANAERGLSGVPEDEREQSFIPTYERPLPWVNNPSLSLPKSVRVGKSVEEILAIKKAMWEERNGKLRAEVQN